jgi:hypothetical protein
MGDTPCLTVEILKKSAKKPPVKVLRNIVAGIGIYFLEAEGNQQHGVSSN